MNHTFLYLYLATGKRHVPEENITYIQCTAAQKEFGSRLLKKHTEFAGRICRSNLRVCRNNLHYIQTKTVCRHKRTLDYSSTLTHGHILSASLFHSLAFYTVMTTTMDEYAERFSCPICNEIMMDGVYLSQCGHNFCSSCISTWLLTQRENTCPLCRQEAHGSDITPCSFVRFITHAAKARHGNLCQASEGLTVHQKLKETMEYIHGTFYFDPKNSVLVMRDNRASIKE